MKVRLLSDLHFECGIKQELFQSQGEDVLVLAGDIHTGASNVWTTLKQFAEYQPNIVYILGNHETYRQDYHETCRKLEEYTKGTSIHFLNPGVVYFDPKLNKLVRSAPVSATDPSQTNTATNTQVNTATNTQANTATNTQVNTATQPSQANTATQPSQVNAEGMNQRTWVKFIAAPLWTNFRNNELSKMHASVGINDFRLIEFNNRYFTPNDAVALFDQQEAKEDIKKVIVTHFLPAIECIDPQYLGNGNNTLNDYFSNDLGRWIETLEDAAWVHGHTHSNVDITIGTTRIISNPYGYGKNKDYKECLVEV